MFLSETIRAQENGSRGPHFAKSLNSNFLKGLTYSAMLPVTDVTIIIILIMITIQVTPKPCGCQHPCGCEKPCTFSELKVKFYSGSLPLLSEYFHFSISSICEFIVFSLNSIICYGLCLTRSALNFI